MVNEIFVALLRGINVGGKNTISMERLKATFEYLGFSKVRTYINSGNIVFEAQAVRDGLQHHIQNAIEKEFGFSVPVVLRDRSEIRALVEAIPETWVNDTKFKCDVMFLWPSIDHPKILEMIPHKPEIEDVEYFPGAVVWRVDRASIARGRVLRIIGTDTYSQITVRNVNTVRKLYAMMQGM